MKKIVVICIAFIALIASNANANFALSQLNLKLQDNTPFIAVLDNVSFQTAASNLTIDNVSPGQHKLKVFKLVPNYYKPWITNKVVVYNGIIAMPASTQVFSLIDGFRTYTVINQLPIVQVNNNGWGNDWYDTNCETVNDNNYNNYNYSGYSNNYNTYNNYSVMSNNAFMNLKAMLANNSFDSGKMTIAQQALASNYVTSNQVAQLMELFDFESSRLSFAKYAYSRTIDKQNFYIVNSVFDFNSSISELASYIAGV